MSVVYWIHHPSHTDIFTQGYVGITSRFERRMKEHNWSNQNRYLKNAIEKYGWDKLIKEIVLIADEAYCLMIEAKLRLEDKIGWNLVRGGGKPPINNWNLGKKGLMTAWNKGKSLPEETKKKVSEGVKKLWEDPEYRQRMSNAHKGKSSFHNKNHSQETKEKLRALKTGKPSGKKGMKMPKSYIEKMKEIAIKQAWTCPHCNTSGYSKGAGNRWHFDNCKGVR